MATMTSTAQVKQQTVKERVKNNRMPFVSQLSMITWRTLLINFRVPGVILPPLIISVFFLFIYEATLGGASGFLPGLAGKSYLGFILPLSVISAALSGSGVAGQSIVRDIESGYFDKLLLTPISRSALLLGAMLAGAVLLAIQTVIVIGVALLMGLEPATGLPGLMAVVGFSLLVGTGFAGFSVGIALRSGNAAATQGAGFLFFPLTFLAPSFVPLSLLDGWLRTASELNPITYILEATRYILLDGWDAEIILRGVIASTILGIALFIFAYTGLRARTKRS